MRIVIDLQGAQTESRFRGIGRYSLSLAKAMVRNRSDHEIIIALSDLFPDTIEPLRAAFDDLLPQENIRVWYAPGPVRENDPGNTWRRETAELIREAFLASLHPDVVLVTSLFEGFGDDAVTSIGVLDTYTPVAVILYDLIPLISPDIHFRSSKLLQDYYYRKIASLKRSKRLLAISDSSRQEAVSALDFDEHDITNISGAHDTSFQVLNLSEAEKKDVCRKVGITKPFVMYTGGADDRKNLYRLIQAFANLEARVRDKHQLVLVGKMPEGHVSDLLRTARKSGLASDEVIMTGYVEDVDLLKLYNSCALFVFPSLHEGFGLCPLEAMSCGAAVIAANATSLPEVIGRNDALFDPNSVTSISDKIKQVLTDEAFRASLTAHGQAHTRKFSWDESANRALKALQDFDHGPAAQRLSPVNVEKTSIFRRHNKKILLVKLDHMGDFILAIPAITKLKARYPYASIDVVLGSWNAPIARTLKLFDNIYTFDFFKNKSAEPASTTNIEVNALLEKLGNYDIAIDLRRQKDTRFFLVKTKAKLKVGYETFDSDIDARLDISIRSYPDTPFETSPLNRTPITAQMLKLVDALPDDINDFVFFPELGEKEDSELTAVAIFPNAGNDVKEWDKSNYKAVAELLEHDPCIEAINVYFASANEAQDFGFKLGGKLRVHAGLDFLALTRSLSENIVCISGNSFGVHLASYLGLVAIGIYAGNETVSEWAPVFDNSYVIHSAAPCSPCHIAKRSDCTHRISCLSDITVDVVHSKVIEAVLSVKQSRKNDQQELVREISQSRGSDEIVKELINSIADLGATEISNDNMFEIAKCIANNQHIDRSNKQLFVDISELVHKDAKSGIQRVVRSILRALLESSLDGYSVIPVYAGIDKVGYLHAARFTRSFLGKAEASDLVDEPVEYRAGDIFLGLDLQPQVVSAQQAFYQKLRRHGVQVQFVVYDLLCILMPQNFVEGAAEGHSRWLKVVAESDGAICISKAVADELSTWIRNQGPERLWPFKISWFHLGADVENSAPIRDIPEGAQAVLNLIEAQPSFLMVGTIEPRKGHAQALAAFEQLWAEGVGANLVIVGKQGWMVESLIDKLRQHPELGKRLFWLDGVSDEYLEKVYAVSTCLIAASEGEGFGLPLIEAARHELPIIARDIPVFREVAGEHAYYFSGLEPENLPKAIEDWMELDVKCRAPQSKDMTWLTWKESAANLTESILSASNISGVNMLMRSMVRAS